MFPNNYSFNPNLTQPFGMAANSYYNQFQSNLNQPQNFNGYNQTNTNKVFVNGLEDAKNKFLPANSDFIFLDNDAALLYEKKVDATGKMQIKAYDIVPHEGNLEKTQINDLNNYVKREEFEALKKDIYKMQKNKEIKEGEETDGI